MSDSFDFAVKKDDLHETTFLDAPSEAEISLLPEQALLDHRSPQTGKLTLRDRSNHLPCLS